jgi:hypothetical protein
LAIGVNISRVNKVYTMVKTKIKNTAAFLFVSLPAEGHGAKTHA